MAASASFFLVCIFLLRVGDFVWLRRFQHF
ncbi:hypothetical protein BpHYR1_009926 [Brachionus plicatilis]|uniref:Uncharacterized protein n=1 Tax=Brachionus plicatilis TaxID=10195 RepID=A0A3M7P716_BRAPC|nr:hypothetical protein BpHYR1_009926 [Brachionus plicatilis]